MAERNGAHGPVVWLHADLTGTRGKSPAARYGLPAVNTVPGSNLELAPFIVVTQND
ncbi:MAG: hypothetical protein ACU84Q_10120 [Gammaproteobacteria bacterium]